MEPREPAAVRYRLKIDHARRVERVLQWLGWTVAVLATTSLVGFAGCGWPAGSPEDRPSVPRSAPSSARSCRAPPLTEVV
jgi:hypothetical protein